MADREHAARMAADQGSDRRWLRVMAGIVGFVVLLSLVLGVLVFLQRGQIGSLHDDVGALRGQVYSLGGTPVAGTPGQPGEPGAQGIPGQNGVSVTGAQGPQGLPGRDGESPPCLQEALACQGLPGRDGSDGTPGSSGQDGTNGQDGATGPAGPAGPQGEQGPQGDAGPTCPDGYEQRSAVITAPDGSTYQGVACVLADSSTPPSTSGGGGLLGLPTG